MGLEGAGASMTVLFLHHGACKYHNYLLHVAVFAAFDQESIIVSLMMQAIEKPNSLLLETYSSWIDLLLYVANNIFIQDWAVWCWMWILWAFMHKGRDLNLYAAPYILANPTSLLKQLRLSWIKNGLSRLMWIHRTQTKLRNTGIIFTSPLCTKI